MEKPKKIPAFIRNTYQMLEREDIQNVVGWSSDGRGFIIKQIDAFSQQILPQYFKHKKYSSFVRQLNMYGFHKQRQQLNHHFFVHEHFRKGVLEDIKNQIPVQIKRKPEKKKKGEAKVKNQVLSDNKRRRSQEYLEEQFEQRSVSIVMEEQNADKQNDNSDNKNEEQSMNHEYEQNQNDELCQGKQYLEQMVLNQNQMLRDIHERIRNDVLSLKKIQLRQIAGDSDYENDRDALVGSLIHLLKGKIEEGNNLLNNSETCLS